jgi:hypothetical protein
MLDRHVDFGKISRKERELLYILINSFVLKIVLVLLWCF